MIEDKKIGLRIAESSEEALWENVRKEAELLIKQSEDNLIIQREIKKLAEKKLQKWKKPKEMVGVG